MTNVLQRDFEGLLAFYFKVQQLHLFPDKDAPKL